MTENLKAFLEKVSADEALAEKAKALDGIQDKKEAIAAAIRLAEEAGCILTEADLVPQRSEVSDDELSSVSGGYTMQDVQDVIENALCFFVASWSIF
jgi:predicted ribosomally synthesized peptide with nif11-like leader